MASPLGDRRRRHPGRQLARHRDQDQPAVAARGPSSAGSTASTAASAASTTGAPVGVVAPRPRRPGCRGRAARRRPGRPAAPAPPRSPARRPARPGPGQPDVGDRLAGPGRADQHPALGRSRLAQRAGRDESLGHDRTARSEARTVAPAARSAGRHQDRDRAARPAGRGPAPGPSAASRPAASRRNSTSRRQPGPGTADAMRSRSRGARRPGSSVERRSAASTDVAGPRAGCGQRPEPVDNSARIGGSGRGSRRCAASTADVLDEELAGRRAPVLRRRRRPVGVLPDPLFSARRPWPRRPWPPSCRRRRAARAGTAVGAVEAAALEHDPDRGEDLPQYAGARRARRQGRVGEGLHGLEPVVAGRCSGTGRSARVSSAGWHSHTESASITASRSVCIPRAVVDVTVRAQRGGDPEVVGLGG